MSMNFMIEFLKHTKDKELIRKALLFIFEYYSDENIVFNKRYILEYTKYKIETEFFMPYHKFIYSLIDENYKEYSYLPLCYSIYHDKYSLFKKLINECKNKLHKLVVFNFCLIHGKLKYLKWFIKKKNINIENLKKIIQSNRLDFLIYINEKYGIFDIDLFLSDLVLIAAEEGNIEIFHYLINGGIIDYGDIQLNNYVCHVSIGYPRWETFKLKEIMVCAAKNGHVKIIEYMIENIVYSSYHRSPLLDYNNTGLIKSIARPYADIVIIGIEYNKPELFELIYKYKYEFTDTEKIRVAKKALEKGDEKILKWVDKHVVDLKYFIDEYNINFNDISTILFLKKKGKIFTERDLINSIEKGNLKVIKYIDKICIKGYFLPRDIKCNNIKVLDWLKKKNYDEIIKLISMSVDYMTHESIKEWFKKNNYQ